ncbi:SusD/RagB family nutrient-binding outer membrane lipoprotein [Chryseobacterium sp. Chry.R1]|uniref:SusD/RagB family nutrient-binding outer membrane lipoprotein n=1 Tax=unclassified Chryseobacterium TaxID=2593645 RepID=UPI001555DC90|nr:SusD/RagB family nutrient-binding outer membrane lipoprotein [Chryseobacterium sp. LAM-KRS1]
MKKIFLAIISSAALISCQLDDNISPNTPTVEKLSPRNLLAAAETTAYTAQTTGMFQLSNIWMNCWAGNIYQFASPMTREYQMDVASNFYGGIWNENYLAAANSAAIIRNENAASFPFHTAIAKILLANSMQYIVDFYGDAPYSQAFMQQENISPKYDKGEDIYKDLVVKLNEAINTIDNAIPTANNGVNASEDVIFAGDMNQWKKFANTIKLRILLRQSKVTDPSIVQFRNAQLAQLQGQALVDADVVINPGYNSSAAAQQNPLYRQYGYIVYDGSALNTNGYGYYGTISDHLAKLLIGHSSKPTAGIVDPRATKEWRVAGGTINGLVQGAPRDPNMNASNYSNLGWKYYGNPVNSSMDGYMMMKSESEFLQAEAAVLYPQYFSNAQGHYTQGVTASFTFFGLTGAQATTYLNALNSKTVGWAGAGDKIAAIQYQRLIALTHVRPVETYINYIKTGYPETPLALTAVHPNKPYRLIYPTTEYTGNSANVPNITQADVFVKNQYTPFWNRN